MMEQDEGGGKKPSEEGRTAEQEAAARQAEERRAEEQRRAEARRLAKEERRRANREAWRARADKEVESYTIRARERRALRTAELAKVKRAAVDRKRAGGKRWVQEGMVKARQEEIQPWRCAVHGGWESPRLYVDPEAARKAGVCARCQAWRDVLVETGEAVVRDAVARGVKVQRAEMRADGGVWRAGVYLGRLPDREPVEEIVPDPKRPKVEPTRAPTATPAELAEFDRLDALAESRRADEERRAAMDAGPSSAHPAPNDGEAPLRPPAVEAGGQAGEHRQGGEEPAGQAGEVRIVHVAPLTLEDFRVAIEND